MSAAAKIPLSVKRRMRELDKWNDLDPAALVRLRNENDAVWFVS
jgi:hypothetical protein